MNHFRRIEAPILNDIQKKMVWLAGPRQTGKTTIGKKLCEHLNGEYLSWDITANRQRLKQLKFSNEYRLWVFDEIHKSKRWRNWLKGVYDEHHNSHSILVTGSARLETLSRGGDSLQGRYFLHRLHPFTLSELLGISRPSVESWLEGLPILATPWSRQIAEGSEELLELGGFPEPLFSGSSRSAKRWRMGYASRLVREELRDIYQFQNLDLIETLYERLSETVGAPLSIKPFSRDLEVAFETVKSWIAAFEQLYACFRVPPFGPPRIRAIKRDHKLYMWDWGRVEVPGFRLENLVASHLLRFIHWCEDLLGEKVELRYFKDVDGHEVDFILLRKRAPWIAIEVKSSEQKLDANLKYFLERVKCPFAFQLQLKSRDDYSHPDINGCKIRLVPVGKFLAALP